MYCHLINIVSDKKNVFCEITKLMVDGASSVVVVCVFLRLILNNDHALHFAIFNRIKTKYRIDLGIVLFYLNTEYFIDINRLLLIKENEINKNAMSLRKINLF